MTRQFPGIFSCSLPHAKKPGKLTHSRAIPDGASGTRPLNGPTRAIPIVCESP